jgi:hypothetical protein
MRTLCAILLTLLLAVRSLAPAGFMPAFDHGRMAIVACPDAAGGVAPITMHHHHSGGHQAAHLPCPYASASSLGAVGADLEPVPVVPVFAATPPAKSPAFATLRDSRRYRPPAIGPPLST